MNLQVVHWFDTYEKENRAKIKDMIMIGVNMELINYNLK